MRSGRRMSTRMVMDGNADFGAVATALRRVPPPAEPASPADANAADVNSSNEAAAPDRPLRVGVLVDLAYAPSAGGHVKCWQRLAEAAVEIPEALDLTVHFHGPEKRDVPLSPSVRYALLPPV